MAQENKVAWRKGNIKFNKKRDNGIISKLIFRLYKIKFRFSRNFLLKIFYNYVGHHCEFHSKTLRKIFSHYFGVEIGMYTHGACFIPNRFPPGTKIGRYCSLAVSSLILNVNHPMNLKSSHALFFNPACGYSEKDIATYTEVTIGNDVWIGANAIILPSVSSIGDGAIIGAGAVVNKNIPAYAVMVGNPARIVRFRFSEEVRNQMIESKWWKKSIEELLPDFKDFQTPIESTIIR